MIREPLEDRFVFQRLFQSIQKLNYAEFYPSGQTFTTREQTTPFNFALNVINSGDVICI